MCGIIGIITGVKDKYCPIGERMANAMAHRGPDNSGKFIDADRGIYLFHRRLSIIDLSPRANQPLLNERRDKVLLANCEIYNYKELRKQLQTKGHVFYSQTDAEVIIHAYEEYGADFVSYLDGMFAFAIWDGTKQTLLICRDRMGIKPLYYINNRNFFAFSSEVKAFFELGDRYWDKQVDEEKLENLVFFPYISDNENTIFKDGGVDSSLIYSLATQFTREVHIFTARYEHKLDESCFARIVSSGRNKFYHEIAIDIRKEIVDNIEKIIPFFDDLSTLDGGFFMTYLIAEQVKKYGVKVLLVGDGADELFGGYSWYGMSQVPLNFLPLYFKSLIYYYALSRTFSSFKCLKYINDIYRKFKSLDGDIFKRISKFELTFQLPNHFLNRVDKATMAHGIEGRVPYMDTELVSFVYSLPRKFKLSGEVFSFSAVNEKYILRQIAKKYLPQEIVYRKKYGFSIPMAEVLGINKGKVRDYLLDNNSVALRYFKKGRLLNMIDFKEKMYHPIEKEKEFLIWRLFLIAVYMREMVRQ
jgi:asparagine synthase (glutamine-hydrolysing)